MTKTLRCVAIPLVQPLVGFCVAKPAGEPTARKHTVCRDTAQARFAVDALKSTSRDAVVMTRTRRRLRAWLRDLLYGLLDPGSSEVSF